MVLVVLSFVLALPLTIRRFSITSPEGFIVFHIGVFYILKSIINVVLGYEFLEHIKFSEINRSLLFLIGYLLIAFFVYALCLVRSSERRLTNLKNIAEAVELGDLKFQGWTLALFVTVWMTILYQQGYLDRYDPLSVRKFMQSGGKFYFIIVFIFLFKLNALEFTYRFLFSDKRVSLEMYIGVLSGLLFAGILGYTSLVFLLAITPILFISVFHSKRLLELFAIAMVPLAATIALVHNSIRIVAQTSPSDLTQTSLFAHGQPFLRQLVNRFDYLEMFHKGLHHSLQTLPDLGFHIMQFPVQAVPRVFWPDKPYNYSSLMTRELLPQNWGNGTTANFSSLNEFMMAFGLLGVLLGGMFLGFMIFVLSEVRSLTHGRKGLSFLYLLVLFQYFESGFVGGFFNDAALPALLINSLLFLALIVIVGRNAN